jgi:hypothetical protein
LTGVGARFAEECLIDDRFSAPYAPTASSPVGAVATGAAITGKWVNDGKTSLIPYAIGEDGNGLYRAGFLLTRLDTL